MSSYPEPQVVYPTSPHTHTFIILHGRGSNGDMFSSQFLRACTASGLNLPQVFPGMKFICPTARKRAAVALKRALVNQWFDIYTIKDPSKGEEIQVEGLRETTEFLRDLITKEMELIPPENIILGGLSQGCATALHALMTLNLTLGAFVGMSGWFPFVKHLKDIVRSPAGGSPTQTIEVDGDGEGKQTNIPMQAVNFLRKNMNIEPLPSTAGALPLSLQTPVFIGHGEIDDKVVIGLGRQIHETAVSLGMDSTFKEYKGFGHWFVEPEEIDDVADFLSEKAHIAQVKC
jgi:predicted esterase